MTAHTRLGLLMIVTACGISAAPVKAHHGGAVEWQDETLGPVTGAATEFRFTFPHVVLYMDIEQGGETRTVAMVTRWTPTILRKHGWSRDSIKPGDEVTVTYLPHISDPTVASMQTIIVNGESLTLDAY